MTGPGPGGLSYGEMRERIQIGDVGGKPAVLTIKSAEVKNLAPRGDRREENKIVLVFVAPDREYVVNSTSYKTLVSKLGAYRAGAWINRQIVMAPTKTEFEGQTYEKLHVATPEVWDLAMEAFARRNDPPPAKAAGVRRRPKAK